VNLLGAANVDALVTPADDDDGPDGVDTIEFSKAEHGDRQATGVSAAGAADGVVVPDGQVDRAWIARNDDGSWAAVTVRQGQSDVARIDVKSTGGRGITSDLLLQQMLGRAAAYCADHGALKLVLRPEGVPIGIACYFVESRGFQYTRLRTVAGVDQLEFYRDLYRRTAEHA
jgi:hypothetical protein